MAMKPSGLTVQRVTWHTALNTICVEWHPTIKNAQDRVKALKEQGRVARRRSFSVPTGSSRHLADWLNQHWPGAWPFPSASPDEKESDDDDVKSAAA